MIFILGNINLRSYKCLKNDALDALKSIWILILEPNIHRFGTQRSQVNATNTWRTKIALV